MFSILIADDDINFIKLLLNDILSTKDNLRVSKIATNGQEALDLMNSEQFDIILLDLKMPFYTGLQVIEMLSEEKKKRYNRSIILITGEPEYVEQLVSNPLIAYIVFKGPCQHQKILETIDSLIDDKSNSIICKKITNELHCLGYNLNHVGTKYLIDTIFEIYINHKYFNGNLKKEIYPVIAFHYNKSVHNIKCNITRATESMVNYCDKEKLVKYFGGVKPKTKLVIDTIINKLY